MGAARKRKKEKRREGTKRVILTQLSGSVAMGGLKTGARVGGREVSEGTGSLVPPLCPPEEVGCPVIQ